MASSDWATPRPVTVEQRTAAELVRRYSLVPPVDVQTIVEVFADVEFALIPVECDGLVLGLHGPRPRPLVIVHSDQAVVRQRFTLAHELGHVLLPWHLGTGVACDTGPGGVDTSDGTEPEANRFASELLLPSAWLAEQIGDRPPDEAGPLIEAMLVGGVSSWVACLRALSILPPGFVFAVLDDHDRVVLSGQTEGSRIQPPTRGELLESRWLDRFAVQREVIELPGRRIVWWCVLGRDDELGGADDARPSREILDSLLSRHVSPQEQTKLAQSLGGVIGAANGDAVRAGETEAAQLFVRFRGRFARKRDVPSALIEDPEFEVWLAKRASELGT